MKILSGEAKAAGANIPANPNTGITIEEFQGLHPSGSVGYHIHKLDPVYREKTVWHVNYQDVIAIGKLFAGALEIFGILRELFGFVPGKQDVKIAIDLAGLCNSEGKVIVDAFTHKPWRTVVGQRRYAARREKRYGGQHDN